MGSLALEPEEMLGPSGSFCGFSEREERCALEKVDWAGDTGKTVVLSGSRCFSERVEVETVEAR